MSINFFFTVLIGLLFAIFFAFSPLNIKKKDFGEIPIFELENFELIELNTKGLATIMIGNQGVRHVNRYIVYNINFTDNSNEYIANMLANKGVYKGDVINLDGNITYTREDSITFSTQKAIYNKQTNIVVSPTAYTSTYGSSSTKGSYIKYNNILGQTNSRNITTNYKLKER